MDYVEKNLDKDIHLSDVAAITHLPPTKWRNPEAILANYESILVRRQQTGEVVQQTIEDNMFVKEATWLAAADWRKMYPDVEPVSVK